MEGGCACEEYYNQFTDVVGEDWMIGSTDLGFWDGEGFCWCLTMETPKACYKISRIQERTKIAIYILGIQ